MDFFAWLIRFDKAHGVRIRFFRAKADGIRTSVGPSNSQASRLVNLPRGASADGCGLEKKRHKDVYNQHKLGKPYFLYSGAILITGSHGVRKGL